MFFTVILGHFVAACFACMGLLNCCYCIGSATPQMGADNFFAQLSVAAWPLAVAAALEILLQLLGQVELMRLKGETAAAPAVPAAPASPAAQPQAHAPKAAETKKKEEKKPEPDGGLHFFPIREPAPKTSPAPAEEKKPESAEEKAPEPTDFDAISAVAEQAGKPEPRPEHLNEPADHKAADAPAEEKTDAPAEEKESGLRFFKVD